MIWTTDHSAKRSNNHDLNLFSFNYTRCCPVEVSNFVLSGIAFRATSVTIKKSPNVYKSCTKMISLEKWKILTPLQNLPKNVGDLGKLIVAKGFKKLPKVQYIAQSGHTVRHLPTITLFLHNLDLWSVFKNFNGPPCLSICHQRAVHKR